MSIPLRSDSAAVWACDDLHARMHRVLTECIPRTRPRSSGGGGGNAQKVVLPKLLRAGTEPAAGMA